MSACQELPACRRDGCGLVACSHDGAEPHTAVNCEGYMYPEGWGICQREGCGLDATQHTEAEPHTAANCEGFVYAQGITAAMFIGGGGTFGGGGATRPW